MFATCPVRHPLGAPLHRSKPFGSAANDCRGAPCTGGGRSSNGWSLRRSPTSNGPTTPATPPTAYPERRIPAVAVEGGTRRRGDRSVSVGGSQNDEPLGFVKAFGGWDRKRRSRFDECRVGQVRVTAEPHRPPGQRVRAAGSDHRSGIRQTVPCHGCACRWSPPAPPSAVGVTAVAVVSRLGPGGRSLTSSASRFADGAPFDAPATYVSGVEPGLYCQRGVGHPPVRLGSAACSSTSRVALSAVPERARSR